MVPPRWLPVGPCPPFLPCELQKGSWRNAPRGRSWKRDAAGRGRVVLWHALVPCYGDGVVKRAKEQAADKEKRGHPPKSPLAAPHGLLVPPAVLSVPRGVWTDGQGPTCSQPSNLGRGGWGEAKINE